MDYWFGDIIMIRVPTNLYSDTVYRLLSSICRDSLGIEKEYVSWGLCNWGIGGIGGWYVGEENNCEGVVIVWQLWNIHLVVVVVEVVEMEGVGV